MSKRLLIDTHVFIWWMTNPYKIGPSALKLLHEAEIVYVSAVVAWEIAVKAKLGKLKLAKAVSEGLRQAGFRELPLRIDHAEASANVQMPHKDPFDRLLLAVADAEGLSLLTSDAKLVKCSGTIDARL